MALYIPHSILHPARLLYVRPETFGPYYVHSARLLYVRPETFGAYYAAVPLNFHTSWNVTAYLLITDISYDLNHVLFRV